MNDKPDPPTQPSPIEQQLVEFLDAKAAGKDPDPADYAGQLDTDDLRAMFFDAVAQVDYADRHLPVPIEPLTVLAGRYELQAPIGSGGMGQVWRARDRKLGNEVAVKVLNLLARASLDVDQLVEREGRLLAKLAHPGVVRVVDSGRDGDHRFLVMDLIGGSSLDDVIDDLRTRQSGGRSLTGADLLELLGPPAPGRKAIVAASDPWPVAATKVFVELLRTLEATHGVGVVHRDLKPGNVRLIGGGEPVLLDFGMGFVDGGAAGKLTGGMFGTAPYAAPEQWDGVERVGVHTDIYQAGVVFYELLTLQRCFDEETPVDTMRAIRDGRFKKPRMCASGIDARLEACVLCAMDVQPRRRYASAAKFRADLERFLAGELPEAAAALRTLSWRLRSFGRRHRIGLGLVAAACIGALTMLLWHEGRPRLDVKKQAATLVLQLEAPATVLAFRAARDEKGDRLFAPVQLRSGSGKPWRFSQPLTAGTNAIAIEDLGDPARVAASWVNTLFLDDGDEAGRAKFDRIEHALKQASHIVERRNGEWLNETEFFGLFEAARGAPGSVALPAASLHEVGTWELGTLRAVVVDG
ncbi:MAG: serine/threonine-protein kinase [Planctomycetota bacterium]